jgi:transposase
MALNSLQSLLRSEKRSHLYLISKAWHKHRRFCVRCHSLKIYRLADQRYRCARCGYTFHDFTRRWIGELNLTARQWLWVLKLFELEVPPPRIAKEVDISYPTALKATYLMRRAIAQSSSPSVLCLKESDGDAGHGFGADQPTSAPLSVFGIFERDGKVTVCVSGELSAEAVLREHSKFVKQGSIIFTGRFGEYDALILRRRRLPPGAAKPVQGKFLLNGLESFWSFARQRLGKFHATSDQELFFFLSELAFRYNHRQEELFDSLAGLMTTIMPNLDSAAY